MLDRTVDNIKIDAEFKSLIPALLASEFAQLEQNIKNDECHEPLSVWAGEGILVDGHNRHEICIRHKIPFEIKPVRFKDREHAKLWIGERQLGRRTLTDDQRAIVANDVREIRSGIAIAEQRKLAGAASGRSRRNEEAKSAPPVRIAGPGRSRCLSS
jgi:hypothetical protein